MSLASESSEDCQDAARLEAEDLKFEFLSSVLAVRGRRPARLTGRQLEILVASHGLMCEGGFDEFSVRKVAAKVGISLAALQHHFKTKEDLIYATIEHQIDLYEDSIVSLLSNLEDDPEVAFNSLIEFFYDDAQSRQSAAFSFHFYSLANCDPAANKALANYEKLYRDVIGLLMRRLVPSLTRREASARAALITCLVDGTMPLVSEGRLPFAELQDMKRRVLRAAMQIARDFGSDNMNL